MLSKEEKNELLLDGKSAGRKKTFKLLKRAGSVAPVSLNNFIEFLAGLNNLFPAKAEMIKKTITTFNKL